MGRFYRNGGARRASPAPMGIRVPCVVRRDATRDAAHHDDRPNIKSASRETERKPFYVHEIGDTVPLDGILFDRIVSSLRDPDRIEAAHVHGCALPRASPSIACRISPGCGAGSGMGIGNDGGGGISSHNVTDALAAGSDCGADTVTIPNPLPCCRLGAFSASSMARSGCMRSSAHAGAGGPAADSTSVIGTKETRRCFRMATVSGRFRIQRNTCHRAGTIAAIAIRARALRMAAENA
ncbi:hypothetical protein [Burkholderia cenocepacia]|uniref:hypothetical protein n=1 Tax=Burkholderia cenocepacia TaxID=95486 RepID=UPI0039F121D9